MKAFERDFQAQRQLILGASMSTMGTVAIPVRTAILGKLQEKDYRAIDLLQALVAAGYSDSDIKLAFSDLLHEGKIELTPDRMLKLAAEQDAA